MSILTKHRPEPGSVPAQSTPRPAAPAGFSWQQAAKAFPVALAKLDPRRMWHTPVMFVVEAGAALITVIAIAESFTGGSPELRRLPGARRIHLADRRVALAHRALRQPGRSGC